MAAKGKPATSVKRTAKRPARVKATNGKPVKMAPAKQARVYMVVRLPLTEQEWRRVRGLALEKGEPAGQLVANLIRTRLLGGKAVR